jgi:hypothetical protein
VTRPGFLSPRLPHTCATHLFEEMLASVRHSAVHLEMRDGYMTSDPVCIAWREGKLDDPVGSDTGFEE